MTERFPHGRHCIRLWDAASLSGYRFEGAECTGAVPSKGPKVERNTGWGERERMLEGKQGLDPLGFEVYPESNGKPPKNL